jgi:hypothetical protein
MMAGREPSITRRRVLGAAAALSIAALIPASALTAQPGRSLWNRRLARYHRLAAQAETVATSGWFRAANDRHERDLATAKVRFGSYDEAQDCPEGRAVCKAIWRQIDDAEDAYWDRCTVPMQKAAVALALTPIPDLEAVRAKIAVMLAQELETLDRMPRHPLEVLLQDLERLRSVGDYRM